MRVACLSLAWAFLIPGSLRAQAPPIDPAQQLRETALDDLLAERGAAAAMERAIKKAKQAGVSQQAILEARFLYHIDLLDDAAIAAMLPEFLEQAKHFKIEDSAIFAVKEDWLSVVEYVKAIHALEKGDREGFKQHIKEAFWLGPRQAAAFAPHIERLRHEEAMGAIRFDFKQELAPLDGSKPKSLDHLIREHKALLLHFWSPNSRECMASMPDFARTAEMLINQGIAVASLCAAHSPQAAEISKPYNQGKHGSWLIDPDENSLGTLLRVQNLPTMALIHPDGRVLYSGDPTDMQFWLALEKLEPKIRRPDIENPSEP